MLASEITRLRRYLRDPDSNIWTDGMLIELYNHAQDDLQNATRALEDLSVVGVPPKYGMSYTHDWESAFLSGNAYRCLRQQQGFYAHSAMFEIQEFFNIDADVTDAGSGYTHPFEAWIEDPNKPVEFPFPDNYHSAKAFLYDNKAIEYKTKKNIQSEPSWATRSGETMSYYIEDDTSNTFVPFPRPSTASWNDETGQGMVTSVDGDTTSSEDGMITQRTGSVLSSESGAAVVVLETDDNFAIVYDVTPKRMSAMSDESDWPEFMQKYVRYRALELAYGANTDGRIQSLAEFWGNRYRIGVQAIKKYLSNKSRDRAYRLRTQDASLPVNRKMHPRLPDSNYSDA